MSRGLRYALVAAIAFLAALAGVYAGRALMPQPGRAETELHALLHDELALDKDQQARIEELERKLATRRRALEFEMRAANAHLAEAIQAEHGYGPEVTAAVDHTHQVMGEMQKETLNHLFAMRAVLKPDQQARFDQTVIKALAPEAK